MRHTSICTLLLCLLMAFPQQTQARADSTRIFTTEHPLVYEDAWDLWPYVFLNENGDPDGYNIDLLRLIFKELDIPFIIRLMPTTDAQKDLNEGKSDLMLRMDAEFTRDKGHFSQNIVQLFTHSVVTPKDQPVNIESGKNLKRHTVIVHDGSYSHHLIAKNHWAHRIEAYDDMKEAIQEVSSLDNGIIVWNTMSLKWLMQKFHTDNLVITPIDLPYGEYRFMSNNVRLLEQIDSVYTQLRADNRLQPIQNKWFYPERTETGIPSWVTKMAMALAVIALAVLIYYLIYRFREQRMTMAVRKSNDRLSLILRTSNISIWTYNVFTHTFTWMDEQGKAQQNFTLEEFVHCYRTEDVKRLQQAIDDIAQKRKENITLDIEVFEDNDHTKVQNYTVALSIMRHDKNGRPSSILCTRSDVTKELLRQIRVKDTMLRYQAIFNSVMVDMVAYDANGYITDINQKALSSLGTDLKTILDLKLSIRDVLGVEEIDLEHFDTIYVTQIYRKSLPDTRPLNHLLECEFLYYELQLIPVRDFHGNLIAIYGTGRNVTEIALSYRQLQCNMLEQQEANEEIKEYIHNIDYVLSVGGIRIVRYNTDTHLLTIYHEADTKGITLTQTRLMNLVADTSKKKAERILNSMDNKSTETLHADIKTILQFKSRQPLYLQFHFIPTYDHEGKLKEYFGMGRDISEIKAVETKLAQETLRAQEVEVIKNAFLHNMSFEIRTPLNAVVGFAELFQMEHSQEDEAVFINEIKENSAKLLCLINDILFLSRLDADMITMKTSPVDFAAAIASKVEAAWAHEKKPGVEYVLQNSFRKLVVEIDDSNISIIIEKIILNAVQHTTSGRVLVRYDYLGDQLIVAVEDTGCGIPNDILAHIFERFVTGDSNTSRAGLGLSICHDLVEHLGGSIHIKSTVGKGTSAWFSVPCKALEVERI